MAAESGMPQPLPAAATPGTGEDVQAGTKYRDWSKLLPDAVRYIADEKVLPIDVTEYISLRAVCRPWRDATVDPRVLHPRFFPRSWLMPTEKAADSDTSEDEEDEDLTSEEEDMVNAGLEAPAAPPAEQAKTRFANVRTGATVWIRMPPAKEYGDVLTTVAAEGLLVLYCNRTKTVRLFNPLTMSGAVLPSLAGAPLPVDTIEFSAAGVIFDSQSPELPTVVLVVLGLHSMVIMHAKPIADHWGTVDTRVVEAGNGAGGPLQFNSGLSLHGQFYITTRGGDVLEVQLAPNPHLVYRLRSTLNGLLGMCFIDDITCHLVPSLEDAGDAGDNDNDGMLLVRCYRTDALDVHGVHLGKGSYTQLMTLGNRTIFLPARTLRADKFWSLPQGTIHQYYQDIEDYI